MIVRNRLKVKKQKKVEQLEALTHEKDVFQFNTV